MRTLTQINVPFHSADLVIIEFNNQPFTAMRPIVEGMGLTWQSQYEKLKQRFSSVITEIVTTGKDGKQYNMVCLPVRKLFGWLMTISPNKVKPALRDTVILYQQECDDVLWEYWTKGQAINQRLTISPEQQNALHEIVDRRAGRDRSLRASMWIRHNRHFGIAKYSQLLSIHFDDAKQYLE
ncbi:phage antirepressor N-terminal domain-containing protein, partial [Acinetobacter baumannii]|nr:phage antirepressor N-terminal domain-containing protein [Acinetobacter baumannii]